MMTGGRHLFIAIRMNGPQPVTWTILCEPWTPDMNIATQLRQLETAFSAQSSESTNVCGLNAEDNDTLKKVFSLPPAAFVDAWARALALTDKEFTPSDRDIFVRAAQTGSR